MNEEDLLQEQAAERTWREISEEVAKINRPTADDRRKVGIFIISAALRKAQYDVSVEKDREIEQLQDENKLADENFNEEAEERTRQRHRAEQAEADRERWKKRAEDQEKALVRAGELVEILEEKILDYKARARKRQAFEGWTPCGPTAKAIQAAALEDER